MTTINQIEAIIAQQAATDMRLARVANSLNEVNEMHERIMYPNGREWPDVQDHTGHDSEPQTVGDVVLGIVVYVAGLLSGIALASYAAML